MGSVGHAAVGIRGHTRRPRAEREGESQTAGSGWCCPGPVTGGQFIVTGDVTASKSYLYLNTGRAGNGVKLRVFATCMWEGSDAGARGDSST